MTMPSTHATVLVLGASRGLGLALAAEYLERGAQVTATVRGTDRTALHELRETAGDRLEIERVDITDPDQVQAFGDRLGGRRFDLLFVNAGVTNRPQETSADVSTEEFTRLMVTNALSPMRVIETLGEHVDRGGTIAIMSSGQGSIANNDRGGFEIYRASKATARGSRSARAFPASSPPSRPSAATAGCSSSTTPVSPSPGDRPGGDARRRARRDRRESG